MCISPGEINYLDLPNAGLTAFALMSFRTIEADAVSFDSTPRFILYTFLDHLLLSLVLVPAGVKPGQRGSVGRKRALPVVLCA